MMIWLLFIASLFSIVTTKDLLIPDPSTIIYEGQARFTILSSQLIRLEWSPTKDFVNGKTWIVQSRQIRSNPPSFNVTRNQTHLRIITDYLTLEYRRNVTTTFSQHNIRITIQINGKSVIWNAKPNEEFNGNLLGTIRTLDRQNGSKLELDCRYQSRHDLHCTYGIISRRGYAIIDDTHQPLFDNNTQWPWIINKQYSLPDPSQCNIIPIDERRNCGHVTKDTGETECKLRGCCFIAPSSCFYSIQAQQDFYLFGHGHSYSQALYEFTRLSGSIPLPPRYIFGIFYSRYWPYAEYDQREIVMEYVQHDIPLDIIVTDMDWHIKFYKLAEHYIRDQADQLIGWTGFTFDKHLFPDYKRFLQWCKQLGLRNTLNLHPASGIQPWEEKYKSMAEAMNIDPSTGHYVPFNVTDKQYISSWFNIILHPFQGAGVDFWWLDWQHGEQDWTQNISYTNPTFWLNYLFFTDSYFNKTRPILLHRWGGLGNHRYPIGFSGDVVPSWTTLSFQPYFTSTAANVGYGYWSHDLGGHYGQPDPELYTRWIQWGTFSPIFRTHSSKSLYHDRRLWIFPWSYQNNLAKFTRLRQALVPYIYTAARRTYDTGLSIVLPLYYHYPEYDEAYMYTNQYFFGENLMISPINQPIDNKTGLVENWPIWFPSNIQWVNFFTGDRPSTTTNESFTLDEMPVYAKVGSIIPLLPQPKSCKDNIGRAQKIPQTLLLYTLIGGSSQGKGYVYEDDGISIDYQQSSSLTTAITHFEYTVLENMLIFQISAASGSFSTFPKFRSYEIQLRGIFPATNISVNNIPISFESFNELINIHDSTTNSYTYDGSSLSILIYIRQSLSTSQSVRIQIQLSNSITHPLLIQPPISFVKLLTRCQSAKILLDQQWGIRTVYMEDYPLLLDAAATGLRITHSPINATNELTLFFTQRIPGACDELSNKITNLDSNIRNILLVQLQCNIFKQKMMNV